MTLVYLKVLIILSTGVSKRNYGLDPLMMARRSRSVMVTH